MIQANELRIGNNILLLGEVCTIECISNLPKRKEMYWIKTKEFIDTKIIHFKPIPLTEEILLKCGFQIRDKNYSLNYGGESMRFAILETNIKNPFILYFHGRFGFNTESGRKDGDFCITHFHQLQNLYFALTNEELTFNNL